METGSKRTILCIELWHALFVLLLLAVLGPAKLIEPDALIAGGLFMAVNFFLLSYGIALVLAPLAAKGRVKAGIALLVVKTGMFLGLLTALFSRFEIDAISFAVGFSALLLAIVFEVARSGIRLGT
jgi:hypothetical protein